MSRNSTTDRTALIRLASTMPVGSPERRVILAGLRRKSALGIEGTLLRDLSQVNVDLVREFPEDSGVHGGSVSIDRVRVMPKVDPTTLEVEVAFTATGTVEVSGSRKMVVDDLRAHDAADELFGQAVKPLEQVGWDDPGPTGDSEVSVRQSPDGNESLTLYWNDDDGYQVFHDKGGVTEIPAPVIPNLKRLVSVILRRSGK